MSSLRRDLLERRLWPVVVLLLIAVGAVPVVLLRSSSAAGTSVPLPPASGPGATAAAQATHTPSAVETKLLLARIPRDPFASGSPKLSSTPSSGSSSGSSTTTSTPSTPPAPTTSASSTTTSDAMVSPSPATPSEQSHSSAPTRPSTAPTTTSTSTTSTTPTTPAAVPARDTTPPPAWTIYSVSLRFGKDTSVPLKSDVARLTPMPSARQPQVIFMGVMAGGRTAVFALGAGVGHTGPGICRPNHDYCTEMLLKAGQTEQLTLPTNGGGSRKAILRVVHITSTITHSHTTALTAFERYSGIGACEVILADPMYYSASAGTVANLTSAACDRYRDAVPFAPAVRSGS